MRLFARVAALKSITAAASALGLPKQTVSRRVTQLEQALGLKLMHRTTRRLVLTDVGVEYAERCAEIARRADEANRVVAEAHDVPRGTLRITADPVFGEAFLTPLVIEYARKWPAVRVEVALTRRQVDLIDEGFDVAFRIGQVDDASLSAVRLGPAQVRFCASPSYLKRRGTPATPGDLTKHDCLVVGTGGAPAQWPFRGDRGPGGVPVTGQMTLSSFAMAHAATLAGAGIAIFPEFACASALRQRKLVSVLDDFRIDVGAVWLVHPVRRFLTARVRSFIELARERFLPAPPWVTSMAPKRPGQPRHRRRQAGRDAKNARIGAQ
jgi:DNA-binding transcriptional LysR family regulator